MRWQEMYFKETIMIKLKELINEQVKPGDAFKDGNSIEIAVEKFMDKWRTVTFGLSRMRANQVGTSPEAMLKKQKPVNMTSSVKSKIKKIAMNPEDAHFINQDDSNMVKKLLRVIK